ncbi:MAG TPA: SRPBCC family protein [Pyrinomonadaceae bacterium]|nr:SRPBCC family protein [Pyrinomonadaceae bacterium]
MKILKILGGLVVLLVIAVVALIFLSPTDYKVEREVTINKPRTEVFAYAKMIKNQNDWGPWVKKDPNIKLTYKGNDGEPGFTVAWESAMEGVGVGEQEIKKVDADKRIDSELRFKKPFESTSNAYMTMEDAGAGQTKVKWGMSGSMPRPLNLLLFVMDMDKEVGKDFDAGLANLKSIVEKGGGN